MLRQVSISLLILLSFSLLHAQKAQKNFLIKNYIESSVTKDNPPFFLVEYQSSTPAALKKKLKLLALRQLSPSVFITKNPWSLFSPLETQTFSIFPANNAWKLSPMAERFEVGSKTVRYRFTIEVTDPSFIHEVIYKYFSKATILSQQKIISIETSFDSIAKYFLKDNRVIHIDAATKPVTELGIPGFDLAANDISAVHKNFPNLNGEEMHVGLKEDYYDTTDIDLKGRFDYSPLASKNITNHANYMATIIAGAGNSIYYANGVAREVHLSSSSFEQILPDDDNYYSQNKITVQNHSYGTVIDNNYGLNAVAFDKNANNDTTLVHVFSSGNTGNETSSIGNYAGINGFANLTGNFKMAKNVIAVGATDTFGNPVALSSRGPAHDGRIKPDLAAFQKNGTSESAALVSGTTVLMQQLFQQKNKRGLPSALARAILINSADDVSNAGPDYATGFGNLNAEKAMETIDAGKYFYGAVKNGNEQVFNLTIPAGTSLLKVSLAWNDTAALPNAPAALVNDLDLAVIDQTNGKTFLPWVLSSVANVDSLNKNAERKRDSLNNEEQVTINNPTAGTYKVVIKGFDVTSQVQKYYVAYSVDTIHSFKWKFSDFVQSDRKEILRWETNIPGRGAIEYALPPFNNWTSIEQNADLAAGYSFWNTPDTISKVMLRAKVGTIFYYSDTFLITTLAKPTTGFLCGDSLFIYWNKLKGINQYQVYQLGEKYMEPLVKRNDTAITINSGNLNSHYVAVAPVFADGTVGVKSFGFDYTAQNAGCFVSSFYADTKDTVATLSLLLGTLFNVDSIYIQKSGSNGFVNIGTIPITSTLTYQYSYQPLSKGVTVFRAKIVLKDGKVIFSDNIQVYYNQPGKYLVFPLPARRNQNIEIYTPTPAEETFTLTDVSGKMVLQKQIQFVHQYIPTTNLSPGVYFYKIKKKDGNVTVGKIVVL